MTPPTNPVRRRAAPRPRRRRAHGATRSCIAACVLVVASACVDGADEATRRTIAPTPSPSPREVARPPTSDEGPFDGLSWSGRAAPVNALLHDDGRRLWSLRLDGRRTLVWRHPRASVASIAASAGGERLALAVAMEPRRSAQPAFLLYLLEPDGSIRAVDTTHAFRSIDAPVFLRPPVGGAGSQHLYWIRTGDTVDDLGRLDSQVMVLTPDGPREVAVPLRYTEGVFDLHAYPGASTFTLTLFRQNDVPTRAEILRNDDARARVTPASLTRWGNNESRAITDVLNGVAWVSPHDYVVPVAQRFHRRSFELRLFRIGCEPLGSHVVYHGGGIDWGYAELPWRLVPGGDGQVLVLGDDDARRANPDHPRGVTWLALDLSSGDLRRTAVEYERGGWAWVAPDRHPGRPGCRRLEWTWP